MYLVQFLTYSPLLANSMLLIPVVLDVPTVILKLALISKV